MHAFGLQRTQIDGVRPRLCRSSRCKYQEIKAETLISLLMFIIRSRAQVSSVHSKNKLMLYAFKRVSALIKSETGLLLLDLELIMNNITFTETKLSRRAYKECQSNEDQKNGIRAHTVLASWVQLQQFLKGIIPVLFNILCLHGVLLLTIATCGYIFGNVHVLP